MNVRLDHDPGVPTLQRADSIIEIGPDGQVIAPEAADIAAPVRAGGRGVNWLFVLTVVLPMMAACVYYFLIAADQYMSQTRFIVRATTSSAASSVVSLIQNQGLARASDETQDVVAYARSSAMVNKLVTSANLLKIYDRNAGDFINRYPNIFGYNNDEKLYKHYRNWMNISVDDNTGIVTLNTFAFLPQDAVALSRAIVHQSELLINRLNDRAQSDSIAFSQKLVDQAQKNFVNVENQLTAFRNANGTADPGKEALLAFKSTQDLASELARLQAQFAQMSSLTPRNPVLSGLRDKIASYQDVIAHQNSKIAGSRDSLATKLQTYEELSVKKLLAMHEVENAVLNLDRARNEAAQQHFYIQTIVEPNLPDVANYPKAWVGLLLTAVLSLCLYLILANAYAITREHRR